MRTQARSGCSSVSQHASSRPTSPKNTRPRLGATWRREPERRPKRAENRLQIRQQHGVVTGPPSVRSIILVSGKRTPGCGRSHSAACPHNELQCLRQRCPTKHQITSSINALETGTRTPHVILDGLDALRSYKLLIDSSDAQLQCSLFLRPAACSGTSFREGETSAAMPGSSRLRRGYTTGGRDGP